MNKIVNRVELSGIIQGFKAGSEIRDLKAIRTTKGISMLSFTLKHNEKIYVKVIAFDKVAEEIARLNQGNYVCLKGTWSTFGRKDQDGKKIFEAQLNASEIISSPSTPTNNNPTTPSTSIIKSNNIEEKIIDLPW